MSRMIRVTLIAVFALLWGRVSAEEVSVEVISMEEASSLTWSITNSSGLVAFSSDAYGDVDSCMMELQAEASYRLNLSITEVAPTDSSLLLLEVNNAAIILINSDIGLGEFSYPFFTGNKEPVLKIVGGDNASISDYPWQVYFSFGNYMCGGTIISKRWILTAAHCTTDGEGSSVPTSQMKIKVGSSTLSTGGKWYNIKSYTVHSGYSKSTIQNDIAVLELYEDIDFANAEIIELISASDVEAGATDPGVMATVSGWGITDVDPVVYTNTLKKVQLPIVSNSTAAAVWGIKPATMLMAGYRNGNKDACSGDSGGPLVVPVDGAYRIAGIVSWGSEDCNTYGAFTRVSSYLDWIEEQTGVTPDARMEVPQGDSEICFGTSTSDYSTSMATANSYEWLLVPDSAGSLNFTEDNATLTWASDFVGNADIQVRAEIEGKLTPWSHTALEVQPNTVVHSWPTDATVCEGKFTRFMVEAEGHDLTYLWYKDSAFYRSTTSGELGFYLADTLKTGTYYCVVSGSCGEISSPEFDLTVFPNTVIQSITSDQSVDQKKDLTLNVSSLGHELTYQWYKDGELISGATQADLPLLALDANDIGQYYVEVMGTCLSELSDSVYVYVDFSSSESIQGRLWPSVVDTEFQIAISSNEAYDFEVFNDYGALIYKEVDCYNQTLVNATSWVGGNYYVRVSSAGLNETLRLLKK